MMALCVAAFIAGAYLVFHSYKILATAWLGEFGPLAGFSGAQDDRPYFWAGVLLMLLGAWIGTSSLFKGTLVLSCVILFFSAVALFGSFMRNAELPARKPLPRRLIQNSAVSAGGAALLLLLN